LRTFAKKVETCARPFACQPEPPGRDVVLPGLLHTLLRTRQMTAARVAAMTTSATRRRRSCTPGDLEWSINPTSAAGVNTAPSSRTLVTTTLVPSPAERPSRLSRYTL
jgi:hypothetical protein